MKGEYLEHRKTGQFPQSYEYKRKGETKSHPYLVQNERNRQCQDMKGRDRQRQSKGGNQGKRKEVEKENLGRDGRGLGGIDTGTISSKKFKYDLNHILNENEMNSTALVKRQDRSNDGFQDTLDKKVFLKSALLQNKDRSMTSVIDTYQRQENSTLTRDKTVSEIKDRNRTLYTEAISSKLKRDYSPSIEDIKKKYGYRYSETQRKQPKNSISQGEYKRKGYEKEKEGDGLESKRREGKERRDNQVLCNELAGKERALKLKEQKVGREQLEKGKEKRQRERIESLKWGFEIQEQEYLKREQLIVEESKIRNSFLKHKYYPDYQQEEYRAKLIPQPMDRSSRYHNHQNKQRTRTCEIEERSSKPQPPILTNNPLGDYEQVHRTLQSTADWMKKSICNLDAKIHQRLSRIIPENSRHLGGYRC